MSMYLGLILSLLVFLVLSQFDPFKAERVFQDGVHKDENKNMPKTISESIKVLCECLTKF